MHISLITPQVQQTICALRGRGLSLPLLLFVAGHQPVAFLAGQALHLLAPLDVLGGSRTVSDWATLLSHPNGGTLLTRHLLALEEPAEEGA